MSIRTQTGCEVEITGFNHNSGAIEIKYKTGHFDYVAIYELKADGGTEEVREIINNLGKGEVVGLGD